MKHERKKEEKNAQIETKRKRLRSKNTMFLEYVVYLKFKFRKH